MEIASWVAINGYTYIILIILFGVSEANYVASNRSQKFRRLLIMTFILLTGDTFSRIKSLLTIAPALVKIGTFITFAFDPLSFFLAMDYINSWIKTEKRNIFYKILYSTLLGFVILNIVMAVVSGLFNINILYYYDGIVYHRGKFFILRFSIIFIYCILIAIYTMANRKNMDKLYRTSLSLFPFIVLGGGMTQVLFAGIQFEYVGLVLGCLLNYLFLQSKDSNVDYLTNALNRRAFDSCLERLIQNKETFSGIMIDIDYFKNINDTYGHAIGDEALQLLAHALRRALTVTRSDVKIYRYGGDEFVVLTDDNTNVALNNSVADIKNKIALYNERGTLPCNLSLSMGYKVHKSDDKETEDEFLKEIDDLMYANKLEHHGASKRVSGDGSF